MSWCFQPGVGEVRIWPAGVGCGWCGDRLAALAGDAGRSKLTARQLACMSNEMIVRFLAGEAAAVPIVDPRGGLSGGGEETRP